MAYGYNLADGELTDFKVDVRLRSLELELLEPSSNATSASVVWESTAKLVIEETRVHFRRPEDDRKVSKGPPATCIIYQRTLSHSNDLLLVMVTGARCRSIRLHGPVST